MEYNFCRRCGLALTPHGEMFVCANNHELYSAAVPGGSVILLNGDDEILVATRAIEPNKGAYDLPGGFCNVEETHQEAAIRELREETGLLPGDYTTLQFLAETIEHYDYKGELKPVISVIFWARITGNSTVKPGDDVATLQWASLADINLAKTDPCLPTFRLAVVTMRRHLGQAVSAWC